VFLMQVFQRFIFLEHFFFRYFEGVLNDSSAVDMKLWLLPVLIWMVGAPAGHAQGDSLCPVPEVVRKSLSDLHPQASEIFWETCSGGYRVSFYEDGKSRELLFSPQGQWVCAHTYLDQEELPLAVRNALRQRFPKGGGASLTYQLMHPGQPVLYRAVFQTSDGWLELTLDASGATLNERLESSQ